MSWRSDDNRNAAGCRRGDSLANLAWLSVSPRDLKRLPTLEELTLDPVYQGYVLLRYQAAAQQADQERQRAEQEQQRADQERQRAERYAALLQERGVDVDII